MDDNLFEILTSAAGRMAQFDAFQKVFKEYMSYPNGLKPERFYDWDPRGRPFFACHAAKPGWHLKLARNGLPICIHIEPQFHRLDRQFWVYLHYEFDPYMTKRTAESTYSPAQIHEFRAEHHSLTSFMHLAELPPQTLQIHEGWNQIGKIEMEIRGMTVNQFCCELHTLMSRIANVVDKYVETVRITRATAGE